MRVTRTTIFLATKTLMWAILLSGSNFRAVPWVGMTVSLIVLLMHTMEGEK